MPPAIQCLDSSRYFPKVKANDHINLTIEPHQIFGLLGPNGCGKTTLLHQLQGLDAPTSGTVKVLGLDPRRDRQELMARIGTQLQEARVIPRLKVIEVLTTFGSFYPQSQDPMAVLDSVGSGEIATSVWRPSFQMGVCVGRSSEVMAPCCDRRFRLGVRKHFLSERVVMRWHSCSGSVGDLGSLLQPE